MRVPSRKFGVLARVTALVLLAWTAIDLTATQVCPAEGVVPAVAVGELMLAALPGTVPANPGQPSHIDDCFCCSHCVNVSELQSITVIGAITAWQSAPAVRILIADGHPLYHPPQSA